RSTAHDHVPYTPLPVYVISLMACHPARSTLFPYTTLFRSIGIPDLIARVQGGILIDSSLVRQVGITGKQVTLGVEFVAERMVQCCHVVGDNVQVFLAGSHEHQGQDRADIVEYLHDSSVNFSDLTKQSVSRR